MATKHTCGGPVFGRLAPAGQCERCDELRASAKPVVWQGTQRRKDEERRVREIRAHDCKKSGCGPVCTFGDW